jgi:hypothetical protein
MLIYVMKSDLIFPPAEFYLRSIKEGYCDFRMPNAAYKLLDAAVHAASDDKHPSPIERRRHRHNGRPRLAAAPGQRATEAASIAKLT